MNWRRIGLCTVLALAACDRDRAAADEVAAEVRALRQALLAQQAPRTAANPPAVAAIAEALQPLREALTNLAGDQRELQQRQLALTQELQRWTVLLADAGSAARRDEATAITARLQQLEAALQAQDARQREVETMLRGALDRTADRLDAFLRAVGAEATSAPVEPAAAPTPAPPPASNPPPGSGTGALVPGAGRAERRGSSALWWGGVALALSTVGFVCVRRWRRHGRPAPRPPVPNATGAAATALPVADAAPGTDPDVQEIWAAAALLGEAVDRLRDSSSAAESAAPSPAPADDDWVVLDDELLHPPMREPREPVAVPATAAPATQPRPAPPAEPLAATCRLRTEDPARALEAVLQVLQQDPRVLRRPEPAVRCSHDSLEVSFRLVPDLAPGERSDVEQRLRDACGAV